MRTRQGGRTGALVGLVVIGLLAPLTVTAAPPAGAPREHQFPDVEASSPFHASISWMVDHGFLAGFRDGTYRPEIPMSREHIVAVLWRMSGEPTTTLPEPFPDIDPSHQFYEAIRWAHANGVVGGMDDGRFHPRRTMTRQALGAVLHRLSGITKTYGNRTFSDVPADHPFYTPIVWWVNSGQAKGYTDGTFRPLEPVTRQTGAQLLALFYDSMGGAWPYFDHSHHAESCTDPITPEQQQAADDLLATVIEEVAARWPTRASAVAAGYRQNAPAFGGEGAHLINDEYTKDGIQLDPTRPESLVLANNGTTVAAAMFVRERVGEPGPQIGGCLTLWHAHDNLCYTAPLDSDTSVVVWIAGLLGPGCPASTMVRITPEMLHVWVDGRADPFEGIET